MKPNKDFKMSKETKRLMAALKFKDETARSDFKKAMIDAQLTSEKSRRDNQRGRVSNGTE